MQKVIQEIRDAGAKVKLIQEGDVLAAINTAFENSGVDMYAWFWGSP